MHWNVAQTLRPSKGTKELVVVHGEGVAAIASVAAIPPRIGLSKLVIHSFMPTLFDLTTDGPIRFIMLLFKELLGVPQAILDNHQVPRSQVPQLPDPRRGNLRDPILPDQDPIEHETVLVRPFDNPLELLDSIYSLVFAQLLLHVFHHGNSRDPCLLPLLLETLLSEGPFVTSFVEFDVAYPLAAVFAKP